MGLQLADAAVLERAIELLYLTTLICIMIFLLNTVRILQPNYVRQPLAYSYSPVIIFPFYVLFVDNQILSDITFLSMQATCLVVYAGISVVYFRSLSKGYLLLISLMFFITAFAIYWLLRPESGWVLSLSHLFTGVGMITASFKIPAIITQHKR